MEIGQKIKYLRLKRGMTLKVLAQNTNLSVGFLSNVERNINSPTISSLQKICQALGTNVTDFFSIAESKSIVTRKHERESLDIPLSHRSSCEVFPVTNKRLQPLIIHIEPKGFYGEETPQSHSEEELGFILAGNLEITVDDEIYELEEGDCIYIDSYAEHMLRNQGDENCTSLWIRLFK